MSENDEDRDYDRDPNSFEGANGCTWFGDKISSHSNNYQPSFNFRNTREHQIKEKFDKYSNILGPIFIIIGIISGLIFHNHLFDIWILGSKISGALIGFICLSILACIISEILARIK